MKKHIKILKKKLKNFNTKLKEECGVFGVSNAKDASALYAKNIYNFLSLIIDKENKKITFNWEDEIVNSVVLTNEGKMRLEQFN